MLADAGYPGLFLLSFLAATLIPVGSEWLLVLMLLDRYDPGATIAVATTGNLLGSCTTYWIGIWGGPWLIRHVLRVDEQAETKARAFYSRYGSISLLLSWLPVIGDPLCLVGGLLRVTFIRFAILVFVGKLGRYAAVSWATLYGSRLITG